MAQCHKQHVLRPLRVMPSGKWYHTSMSRRCPCCRRCWCGWHGFIFCRKVLRSHYVFHPQPFHVWPPFSAKHSWNVSMVVGLSRVISFFLPWEVCMSNAARLVKPSWAALNVACGKCRELIVQEVSNVMVVSLYAFLAASCSEEILYCLLWGLWQVFVIKLFTEEGCCRFSYCVMLVRNG